ncbi:2,5-diketo-D-gluconate reductase A [Isoptericola sp. CG 20/1183]|uniref:2,5-diketo-D-gluconate reductase A n=1 Tax=Isoptericola halotolerans TaxID=300560 RepID=A0ABX5EKT0_9MICO|nr:MULTISPECIES: aldo/keto reductase [Isoptericola]PRZ09323.1 2,5-diketo-D-gluconate reductase A [Isoptericola sp. CG 20/1183]PRZ10124.1 2,5-diketo-D-gluconate reductase A [Isoptericola halotolerans]
MSNESIPSLPLNNGVQIPQLGFGVFQVPPEQTRDVVSTALDIGYRHIDTAQMYRNERGVGEALAASGLDRADYFVTSKLNNAFHAHDDALAAFDLTLEELQLEHVDLFLIHWPLPAVDRYVEAWGALEEIYRSGRARAIGVSNFEPHHLRRLMDETTVVPAVNQVEVHPWLGNEDVRAVDAEHGIVTEAWSPLGRGRVLEDPTIARIAENLGRTPAQVVLRWHIERGDVIFPKSVTPARIGENFRLFDFELSQADMADITALDRGERVGSHPDEMNNTGR